MPETVQAFNVWYEGGDRSVEAELDNLRRRVQTHNDLITSLIVRIQQLESR